LKFKADLKLISFISQLLIIMSNKVIEIRDSLLEAKENDLPIKIALKGKEIEDWEYMGNIESIKTLTSNISEKSFFSLDKGDIRLSLEIPNEK